MIPSAPRRASRRATHPVARLVAGVVLLATACATDDSTDRADGSAMRTTEPPEALALLASDPSPFAHGTDRWEVWVCRVPATVGHPVYADDPWRLARSIEDLTSNIDRGVGGWYAARSHGLYRPVFTVGGRVTLTGDDPSGCVETAIARAASGTDGVLVVADARHRDDVSGGWGRAGTCTTPCRRASVSATGRAVYVGGTDFTPAWGDDPPLDLVQHELGHALGLPHSGDELTGDRYSSPIDVMSDSAAPRQVRTERRDAPDTIGANRVALGWLPLSDVVVVPSTGAVVDLAPSTGADGRRLAVIPLDDLRLVTVELLIPRDANDHLPEPGIAVHLIDQSPTACENPTGPLCTGAYRRQIPRAQSSLHPGIPLLGAGDAIDVGPAVVRVLDLQASGGRVAIEPD